MGCTWAPQQRKSTLLHYCERICSMASGTAVSRLAALGIVLPVPACMHFAINLCVLCTIHKSHEFVSPSCKLCTVCHHRFPHVYFCFKCCLRHSISFRSPFFFDPSLLTAFISCAGNLIFISGQLCTVDGKIADQHKGKVGTSEGCVTQEEA